jgi:phage shock protein PspC (stress-responsive transcriptional regulator)
MKEITRIHIAKVPYDTEVEAKKELELYIKKLEVYSTDTEIINDIEIRITEILMERGVNKNGVISLDDVTALKEQLGEPKDFMGDGDMAIGSDESEQISAPSRKLFRDVDNAILGGVLSGIGAFFGVSSMWVRLLFIIVAFASFGTALLVYLVLWLVVPPAKTAADKLQMTGRAVTIESIREINENEVVKPQQTAMGRRVLTLFAGVASIFAALCSLFLIAAVNIRVFTNNVPHNIWDSDQSGFLTAAYVLVVISGLLLTTLFVLAAYASFTQKFTRRTIISSIVVAVLGLTTFGTAVGLAQYGVTLRQQAVEANTHEVDLKLPDATKTATALSVATPGFNVQYVVDEGKPHASVRVVTDKNTTAPKVTATLAGTMLKIKSDTKAPDVCYWPGCDGPGQRITIYGPALRSIDVESESYVTYETEHQQDLMMNAKKNASVTLKPGLVDTLNAAIDDGASLSTSDATVTHAKLSVSSNADVELGTVQTLDITHTSSCPAGKQSSINVWNASSVTVNSIAQPVKTANLTCMVLTVQGKEND